MERQARNPSLSPRKMYYSGNMYSCYIKLAFLLKRKIFFYLQEYMLIQHKCTFTYSCKNGNHVRRTRNNSKGCSFWRLPALLLCVNIPLKSGVYLLRAVFLFLLLLKTLHLDSHLNRLNTLQIKHFCFMLCSNK